MEIYALLWTIVMEVIYIQRFKLIKELISKRIMYHFLNTFDQLFFYLLLASLNYILDS